MAYKILAFHGKMISAPSGTGIAVIDSSNLPEPEAMTLRFQFSDNTYDPTVDGVGTSGTWTKLYHPLNNIWDWTNENTSWATAFGGGSTSNPGAFADYDNNKVKVIDAGDTSSVTDFSRLFQNCYGITEISAQIDTSNATTAYLMFSRCENCTVFPDLDLRNATVNRGAAALYQRCYKMRRAPSILFPSTSFSMYNLFFRCYALSYVPLYDTSSCTEMRGTFFMCGSLERIPQFNTASVTDMTAIFGLCTNLIEVPDLDTRNVTNLTEAFACCQKLDEAPAFNVTKSCDMTSVFDADDDTPEPHDSSLAEIPDWDWSKATSLEKAFRRCTELTEIPEMTISSSITSVANAFENCYNVVSGAKAMYDVLSQIPSIQDSSKHVDCFKNCGINTVSGYAELEQIPQDWGGLQEPVYEGDWVGSYFWSKYCLDYVDSNMTEIDISSTPTASVGISYMLNGGYVYYSPDAIAYLYSHPELIPVGWHLPTETEAMNFIDTIQAVAAGGTNPANYLESLNLNISVGEGYIINTETYIFNYYDERWLRNNQETIFGITSGNGIRLQYAYEFFDLMPLHEEFYPIRLVKD